MAGHEFRAGVVAVVRRSDDRVLVFRRAGRKGAWQLPQGGMDAGESPRQTVWRELGEETGLGKRDVKLVAEHPVWVTQEYPASMRRGRSRLGQTHRWFTFRVRDDAIEPTPDGIEFDRWRWVEVEWLLDRVVKWRRPAYEQVLGD